MKERFLDIFYIIKNLISSAIVDNINIISKIITLLMLIIMLIILLFISFRIIDILKKVCIYIKKDSGLIEKNIKKIENNIQKIKDIKNNFDNIVHEDEMKLFDIKEFNKKRVFYLFTKAGLFEVLSIANIKSINNYYNRIENIYVNNIFTNFNDDIQIKIKQIEVIPYIHIFLRIEIENKSDSNKDIYINKKYVKLVINNGRTLKELNLDENLNKKLDKDMEIDINIDKGGKEQYTFIFDNVLKKIEEFNSIELRMTVKEKKWSKKKKEDIALKIEKSVINYYIEKIKNEENNMKDILDFKKYLEYNIFGGIIFISMIILLLLILIIVILVTNKVLRDILLALVIIMYYIIYKYLTIINFIIAKNIYFKYKILESYRIKDLEK